MKILKIKIDDEEEVLLEQYIEELDLREKNTIYKRLLFDPKIPSIILLKCIMTIRELNTNDNHEYNKFVDLLEGLIPYSKDSKIKKTKTTNAR